MSKETNSVPEVEDLLTKTDGVNNERILRAIGALHEAFKSSEHHQNDKIAEIKIILNSIYSKLRGK